MATYESFREGDHEFTFISHPVIVQAIDYAYTDLDASDDLYIPVIAGTLMIGVAHEVVTAFSGGTPSCTVGDGDSSTGWLISTDITETSQGNFAFSLAKANTYSPGKLYSAGGYIIVTHAASLAAGAGRVYLFFIDMNENWRTAGQF
jgi:hypothetical protein